MYPWWESKLEAEDNQLAWKMRREVNEEADSETDWSSFQSLKERKTKRLWGLDVWDYKRGKNQDRKWLLLFSEGENSVDFFGGFEKRLLEGFLFVTDLRLWGKLKLPLSYLAYNQEGEQSWSQANFCLRGAQSGKRKLWFLVCYFLSHCLILPLMWWPKIPWLFWMLRDRVWLSFAYSWFIFLSHVLVDMAHLSSI